MRFMKPVSNQLVLAYGIVLAMVAVMGVVPWTLGPTQAQATDQVQPKEATFNGKYVSFNEGLLKIKSADAKDLDWKVADNTKVVSIIMGVEKEGASPEAFKIWEPGAAISVKVQGDKVTSIQLGVKKTPDKVIEKEPDRKKETAGQKQKMSWGRFVSFKDGTVTIQDNSGASIGTKIPESTKTLVWNNDENKYKPASTAETLKQAKPGTLVVVQVANEMVTVRVGARKGQTVGTFVSFKNDRLLILGKDLGESFVKRYGNNVHFNKFREDTPVYESIDGGPYKLVAGSHRTILANVREGTVMTVHAEGDDNITLIQIGVPKKN